MIQYQCQINGEVKCEGPSLEAVMSFAKLHVSQNGTGQVLAIWEGRAMSRALWIQGLEGWVKLYEN